MYDENQIRAIRHLDGPALVIAGPGAGKTYTIVQRIMHLVRHAHIPPENVLVITFTRAAAMEMQKRYRANVAPNEYGVTFGTFHSVYYSILKDNRLTDSIDLIDEKTKKYLIAKSAAMAGLMPKDIPEGHARLLGAVSSIKNTSKDFSEFTFAEVTPGQLKVIFEKYEQSKRELNRIDFDDMISLTKELLNSREDILEKYRRKYRYILVDEAQDMNRIQFDVIRLLASPSDNLFLVGDDDQSIYAFRGADSGIMLSFRDYYPGGKVITLEKNFRSAAGIIEAAGNVIENNKKRFLKHYVAVSSSEAKIRYLSFDDDEKEADILAQIIKKEHEANPKNTIGILYRNHRQSVLIRDRFEALDFDYFGRRKHKSTKDDPISRIISDYLALAVFGFKRETLLRVMNVPDRFLPRTGLMEERVSIDEWIDYHRGDKFTVNAIRRFCNDIDRIRKLPSYGAICYICKRIGVEKYAAENKMTGYKESINYLLNMAEGYSDKKRFLDALAQKNEKDSSDKSVNHGVFLYTFHASKGLEFDSVYIIDATEDVTPSRFAKSADELEEERRMFYVAVTRAKYKLTLVSAKKTGKKDTYPSRFVKEMNSSTRQEDC